MSVFQRTSPLLHFSRGLHPSSISPRPNIETSMGNIILITQSSMSILSILILGKKIKKNCVEPSKLDLTNNQKDEKILTSPNELHTIHIYHTTHKSKRTIKKRSNQTRNKTYKERKRTHYQKDQVFFACEKDDALSKNPCFKTQILSPTDRLKLQSNNSSTKKED